MSSPSDPAPANSLGLGPRAVARPTTDPAVGPDRRAPASARPPRDGTDEAATISVVAPLHDEEGTVARLVEEVTRVFDGRCDFEILLVDDGSTDGSAELVRAASRRDPRVRGLLLRANVGQSAALAAGFAAARGALVATLDADLQCDPRDLPALVARLRSSGADAVVGYRTARQDPLHRRLASRLANRVRTLVLGDRLRDTCCPLRVVRRTALASLPVFDGMHRFLPTLLRVQGFEVLEMPVRHRPRTSGRSKYRLLGRARRGFVDLVAVRWWRSRVVRPVVVESHGSGLRTPTR